MGRVGDAGAPANDGGGEPTSLNRLVPGMLEHCYIPNLKAQTCSVGKFDAKDVQIGHLQMPQSLTHCPGSPT